MVRTCENLSKAIAWKKYFESIGWVTEIIKSNGQYLVIKHT